MDERPQVLLETINPQDLTPEDLQELADELTVTLPGIRFSVAFDEQHGSGVTWHEVLRMWIPDEVKLKDAAYQLLLTSALTYMGRRFRRKHYERRPKEIIFHDSDGKEIGSYIIRDQGASPEEKHDSRRLPRTKPKGRHRKQ